MRAILHLLVLMMLFGVMTLCAQAQRGITNPFAPQLTKWAATPVEQRAKLDQTDPQFPQDFANRKFYADAALLMYLDPPAGGPPADAYLDIVLLLIKDSDILSLDVVRQLLTSQFPFANEPLTPGAGEASPERRRAAVRLYSQFIARRPDNVGLHLQCSKQLELANERDGALALLASGVKSVPEPERRSLRLEMLRLYQLWQRTPPITVTDRDPLLAADAMLLEKRFADAAKKYMLVTTSAKETIERRFAAWAGMLDADPAAALQMAPGVMGSLAKYPAETRPRMIAWTGRLLWRIINYEVPYAPASTPAISIRTINGWQPIVCGLMEQCWQLDPGACARPDAYQLPDTLRYPMAALYALNSQWEKSYEIIAREVTFDMPPPPGGWRIFDGTPRPDANKPQRFTSPTAREKASAQEMLQSFLRTYPGAPAPPGPEAAPLPLAEAQALLLKVQNETNRTKRLPIMIELAKLLATAVNTIDPLPKSLRTNQPPPPTRDVDMTRIAPFLEIMREELKLDEGSDSLGILYEGVLPSMLIASNPQLLDALCELGIACIDVSYSNDKNPAFFRAYAGKRMADYLTARPVYDMRPYAKRFLERFPAPAK